MGNAARPEGRLIRHFSVVHPGSGLGGLQASFCNDLNMGPSWAACADIGERHTGMISGAMNMAGSIAGAAGTAFAGYYFKKGQDQFVFTVYAGSYVVAALCWLAVKVGRPVAEKAASVAV